MAHTRVRQYSEKEEWANSLSHGLGIVLGLLAWYWFFSKESILYNPWAKASVLVYLLSMLSSYLSSTIYHSTKNKNRKLLLQKLDHAAIYVHIAGTYTPFTLVSLRESGYWGWGLFYGIWLLAVLGVLLSLRRKTSHSHLETVFYVLMGCVVFIAFKPLVNHFSELSNLWPVYYLLAGGLSYIIGALFYSFAKVKYLHTVFHFFVLGGSIFHILAIYIAL